MLQRPVEGGVRPFQFAYGLGKGGPQRREPHNDLSTRPFRTVTNALARDPGLLQPFSLLFEPHCPLQVSGVGAEVLVEGVVGPEIEVCFLEGSGCSVSVGMHSTQRLFQA